MYSTQNYTSSSSIYLSLIKYCGDAAKRNVLLHCFTYIIWVGEKQVTALKQLDICWSYWQQCHSDPTIANCHVQWHC